MNSTAAPARRRDRSAADPDADIGRQSPSGTARHVARVAARSRLEDAMRGIAVDLLGAYPADSLSADCAAWVSTTIEAAIPRVRDAALDGLVEALDARLDDVPPDVARQLRQARIRHDAGYL